MMTVTDGFYGLTYNGQSTKCFAIYQVRHSQRYLLFLLLHYM